MVSGEAITCTNSWLEGANLSTQSATLDLRQVVSGPIDLLLAKSLSDNSSYASSAFSLLRTSDCSS